MTTVSTQLGAPTAIRTSRRRASTVALWVVQVGLAAQIAAGGVLKVVGDPAMVAMFDDIGAGQWLRVAVGTIEVAGAVGLIVPRLAGLAAFGLVALLLGAAATNMAALGTSPALPLAFAGLAASIAVARRHDVAHLVRRRR